MRHRCSKGSTQSSISYNALISSSFESTALLPPLRSFHYINCKAVALSRCIRLRCQTAVALPSLLLRCLPTPWRLPLLLLLLLPLLVMLLLLVVLPSMRACQRLSLLLIAQLLQLLLLLLLLLVLLCSNWPERSCCYVIIPTRLRFACSPNLSPLAQACYASEVL
jgi:hypothetical protein